MKTKSVITLEDVKQLAEKGLHQAEIAFILRLKEVARQLNCSRENIRQWCNRYNIQTRTFKKGKSNLETQGVTND